MSFLRKQKVQMHKSRISASLTMIGDLLSDEKLEVKVLQSHDQWFGVTYKEDKESATAALRGLIEKGVYPSKLF